MLTADGRAPLWLVHLQMRWRMIRKSGHRFSNKDHAQNEEGGTRVSQISTNRTLAWVATEHAVERIDDDANIIAGEAVVDRLAVAPRV